MFETTNEGTKTPWNEPPGQLGRKGTDTRTSCVSSCHVDLAEVQGTQPQHDLAESEAPATERQRFDVGGVRVWRVPLCSLQKALVGCFPYKTQHVGEETEATPFGPTCWRIQQLSGDSRLQPCTSIASSTVADIIDLRNRVGTQPPVRASNKESPKLPLCSTCSQEPKETTHLTKAPVGWYIEQTGIKLPRTSCSNQIKSDCIQ